MNLSIKQTTSFKKSYKLCQKRGCNMDLIKDVITKISREETLDHKYKDHPLINRCERELHITPDWLLIYSIDKTNDILKLIETGTHSDLFKN